MTLDLNDPELEFSNLVDAYITWVLAVINDEKLESEDQLLTDQIYWGSVGRSYISNPQVSHCYSSIKRARLQTSCQFLELLKKKIK